MSEPLTADALRAAFRRGPEAAAAAPEPAPVAQPAASRAAQRTPTPMVNRYPGTCVGCGNRVEVGAGVTRKVNGKWETKHREGQCPTTVAPVAPPATTAPAPAGPRIESKTGQVYTGILPGIYTLETDAGHATFRVQVQSSEANFAPGETVLAYLTGPDNTRDYTSFAFLKDGSRLVAWKRFREGHEALLANAKAFLANPDAADLARTCIRCNALLTTPESIAAGLGPTCINKGW